MKAFRVGCVSVVGAIFLLLLAGIAWFVWQGSEMSLPALAKGMPGNSFADGDRAFKERIARLYPAGSPAQRLEADLTAQGFRLGRRGDWRFAELRRFIGCGDKVWRVEWWVENGKLREVSAMYGPVCL